MSLNDERMQGKNVDCVLLCVGLRCLKVVFVDMDIMFKFIYKLLYKIKVQVRCVGYRIGESELSLDEQYGKVGGK